MELNGFLPCMVRENLISEEQAQLIAKKSVNSEMNAIAYAVEWDLVNSQKVKELAISEFGYDEVVLSEFNLKNIPSEYIDQKLIIQTHAIPLYNKNNTLYLGVSDPTNFDAIDKFGTKYGVMTDIVIVDEKELTQTIQKLFGNFGSDRTYNL